MPLTNLGFETADATPGSALAWSLVVTSTAEEIATWGTDSPPLDEDGFEREWSNSSYVFAFAIGDTSPALFDADVSDGEGLEDFEEGWSANQSYEFNIASDAAALFDSGAEAFEDFEEGWSTNESYVFDLVGTLASFDSAFGAEDIEDFEDGWPTGVTFINGYDFFMPAETTAIFDGAGAEDFEDFEETFTKLQVTVDPASDLFTTASVHGFTAGDRVSFELVGSGALPDGVNAEFEYFVIATGLTTTAFRVSITSGGSPINVTDAGAGVFRVVADPRRVWLIEP